MGACSKLGAPRLQLTLSSQQGGDVRSAPNEDRERDVHAASSGRYDVFGSFPNPNPKPYPNPKP